jgi:hypothetical protein
MKIILFISFVIILIGCKSKVEDKPLNESDLIPSQNTKNDSSSVVSKINFRDTISVDALSIIDSIGFLTDSITPIVKKPFLARFGALKMRSFVSHFGADSLQFSSFTFADSVKTKTAFYNWLDRFSDKEMQLKIGDEVNVSRQNILVLVSDLSILSFQCSRKLNVNAILAKYPKNDWKFVIEQSKNSKTTWYSIKKKIKTIIKPTENEGITITE